MQTTQGKPTLQQGVEFVHARGDAKVNGFISKVDNNTSQDGRIDLTDTMHTSACEHSTDSVKCET